ncbi:uncharacterized protein BJ171DRAFT_504161 [Polychytrium aggregatum]|uniref:uncharacterized protein n=1 Tax=Polychytrium aggregatum TaxID=110093 RepID=UPI0022FE5809|nr:uncharacterized protein BJ171DRAFT_504161 [Polychytrium aggregatum]KAI9204950.1 hypothetical protein BJ171DRAFT_504161 [Polychytrium aggregatum]
MTKSVPALEKSNGSANTKAHSGARQSSDVRVNEPGKWHRSVDSLHSNASCLSESNVQLDRKSPVDHRSDILASGVEGLAIELRRLQKEAAAQRAASLAVDREAILSREMRIIELKKMLNEERTSPGQDALDRLELKRRAENRPYVLDDMTITQLCQEKVDIKREIYELRKSTETDQQSGFEDHDILRELYRRYCEIRALIEKTDGQVASAKESASLASINSPATGSMEALKKLRYEKKVLQIKLHAYQDEFMQRMGRPVQTSRDRAPIQVDYLRYKELKMILKEYEQPCQES